MKTNLKLCDRKKTYFIACIMVFSGIVLQAQTQEIDFNFTVEIENSENSEDSRGNLIVNVTGSATEYTYMLYDKNPLKGGKIIGTSKVGTSTMTFENIQVGSYYVCVQNRDKATKCEKISIEISK